MHQFTLILSEIFSHLTPLKLKKDPYPSLLDTHIRAYLEPSRPPPPPHPGFHITFSLPLYTETGECPVITIPECRTSPHFTLCKGISNNRLTFKRQAHNKTVCQAPIVKYVILFTSFHFDKVEGLKSPLWPRQVVFLRTCFSVYNKHLFNCSETICILNFWLSFFGLL